MGGQPVPVPVEVEARRPRSGLAASVIVASYKRPADLRRCLAALAAQTLPPAQVVVAAREDDAETRALLDAPDLPLALDVQLVREAGQRAAMTRGLAAARSEIVCFTDDDTAPRPEWLETIVARFGSDAATGAVGGRDVVHERGGTIDGTAERVGCVLWFGRTLGNHHLESRLQDVRFLKGANMAYRRSALAGFDEALLGTGPQVCMDMEASLSVACRGWRVVYDPEVVVDHYPAPRHDEDQRERPTVTARANAIHNQLYVLLKHAPMWQKPVVVLYAFLVGYRHAPGLLVLLERLARERDRRAVALRFVAAMRGRLLALWTYARYVWPRMRERRS